MDESVTDKEEIKRRLEKMKLQYAKMQRKLTKSERRKSAKNHVRRVLAEQANALSPEVSGSNSCSARNEAASETKVSQESSDGMISRRSGRRGSSLQRSISFKLEDSLEKVNEQEVDVEGAGSIVGEKKRHGVSSNSTNSNGKQCSSIGRESKEDRKKAEGNGDFFEMERTSCVVTENRRSHNISRRCKDLNVKQCSPSGNHDISTNCADSNMKQCSSSEQGKAAENRECSSVKVSRRSHRKKSRRLKAQNGSQVDVVNSLQIIDISSGETPSDIGETEGSVNSENQSVIEQSKKTEKCDVPDSEENVSSGEVNGGACLRWQGIFQGTDPCDQEAWSGVCLYEIRSSTILVMHRSQTAVLWVHTDHWEARSQWTTEKDCVIAEVTLGSSQDSDLLILVTLTKGNQNYLSFLTYNLESDTQQVKDVTLPEILEESKELMTILSGHQGAVMRKIKTHSCHIHFFEESSPNFFEESSPNIDFWQIQHLKEIHANSFITVEGAANMYLCLSSSQLSLWSSRKEQSLLEVDLHKSTDIQIDECLWSKAEGGLLFIITLQQQSSLALCVVNPANGVLLQLHSYMLPCAYHSLRLQDFSVNQLFIAAVYSNNQTLIWDISSGQALTEIQSPDIHTSQVTATSDFTILNGKDPHLYRITC